MEVPAKPPRSRLEKVTKQSGKFKDSILYIIVIAGGLIVGLAWRDAVHDFFIDKFGKNEEEYVKVNFIYAVVVTVALVIVLYVLAQVTRKERD